MDKNNNVERQKYKIVSDGFSSVITGLRNFAMLFKVEIGETKAVSKTNFWQMVIDQFSIIASILTQIGKVGEKKVIELKGDPGDTPTDEQLLALMLPLIPEPIPGRTPSEEELVALIKPLIPQVKNGETPSDERLLALIRPLIKLPNADQLVSETTRRTVDALEPLIPTTEEQAKRLNALESEWLDIDHIKGDFNKRIKPYIVPPPTKPEIKLIAGGQEAYVNQITFEGDVTLTKNENRQAVVTVTSTSSSSEVYSEVPTGSINSENTNFSLANAYVTGKLRIYINGLRQHPSHYTETGANTFSLSEAPQYYDELVVDYQKA